MATTYQYGQPITDEQRLVLESSANNPGQIINSTRPITAAGSTTPAPYSAYTTTGKENVIGTPGQSMDPTPMPRAADSSLPMRSQYGSDESYLNAYNAWQARGAAPGTTPYSIPTVAPGSAPGGSASGTPTISQIYGSATGNNELDAAYNAQGQAIKATQEPIDENKIREQTLQRFQAEIDAVNRFYAEKTASQQAAERIVGEGRLGSGAAVQARRGLLGSDFGNAQTDKVTSFNNQQLQSIADLNNAQAKSEIAAIQSQADQAAQQEIKDKQAAMVKGRQDYIDFLNGQKERLDKRVDTSVAALVAGSKEPSDADLETLAKTLGIDVSVLKDKYAIAKSAKDAEDAKNAPKPVIIDGVAYALQDDGTYKAVTPAKPVAPEKPVVVGGVAYEKQADGTYKAVTPTAPLSADFKFVSATKYQPAGYFNAKTGEFRPVSGGASSTSTTRTGSGGSTGSGSTGTGSTSGVTDTNGKPVILSPLAKSVYDGTIRFDDLTSTEKAKIAPELNKIGWTSSPKLTAGQQDDIATADTTMKLIDQVLGYSKNGELPGVGSLGRGTLGAYGTSILGLGTDAEKNVRSTIGNIRGTIAKLRGGTSFTEGEQKLLDSYVPTIDESPASVINKLNGLKLFLETKNASINKAASDRGITKPVVSNADQLRKKYNY